MRSSNFIWVSAITLFALTGCATVEQDSNGASANQAADEQASGVETQLPAATPGLDPQARFSLILKLLEQGNATQARAELGAYLAARPGSRVAKTLLSQLTREPGDTFPTDSFPVALASGQSLSTLARDYLGDVYLFYALARYNNIDVPKNIRIGQVINIPATAKALAFRDQPKASETDEPVSPQTQEELLVDTSEPADPAAEAASTQSETEPTTADGSADGLEEVAPAIEPDPVSMLIAEFSAASQTGDYTNVLQITADHAQSIAENDWELLRDAYVSTANAIAADQPVAAAGQLKQAANLILTKDQTESAMDLLQQASALDPSDTSIVSSINEVKGTLIEQYHREASSAFRAQELESAISLWDKVLELDPEHSNALVYRAQAIELQERLSNLNN